MSTDPQIELPLTGGCLCRTVRYEINHAPDLVYTCHCTDCQHLTSSAFGIGVAVAEDGVRLTGQTLLLTSVADSGRVKHRRVCPLCGVWVCGEPRIGISKMFRVFRGGTFDTTAWMRPTTHFWVRNKQPWIILPDSDQSFSTQPDDQTEIRNIDQTIT